MTFLQILNIIKETALAQPNVNTVVREFLDLNREDTKYSAVVIQDRDGLRDRIVEQDWNTYTFHLGYVDRLTFDESNRDDIFSTGINVINNIVASIRERWDLEVSIIDRFSTFNQRFTASCAGVYVVLAIQVPISDCVDGEETDLYDKFEAKITENGDYHFVPDGRPVDEIDITVDVPAKSEFPFVDTITENGEYGWAPEPGSVFSEVSLTVSVPTERKPEQFWTESYSISGTEQTFHFRPDPGYVFSGLDLTFEVPTRQLQTTISDNGNYHWEREYGGLFMDGYDITVSVPEQKPEESLIETISSNGSYSFSPTSGSVFSGADITVSVPVPRLYPGSASVSDNGRYGWLAGDGEAWDEFSVDVDVHPSTSLVESITSNGSYHYTGEWKDADITVAVSAAKPEESLVETITSNGSYHYDPSAGSVFSGADISVDVHPSNSLSKTYTANGTKTITGEFNGGTVNVNVHPSASLVETITSNGSYSYPGEYAGAAITVAVPVKTETGLVESITSNGSYHYDPAVGSVFSGADISVDVHPSAALSKTYTTNGTKAITGEFNGGTVNVNVHPSATLSKSYTTNGTKTITGEFNGGTVNVDVHPSQSLIHSISSNGVTSLSGEWKDAEITVAVPTTLTVTKTQAQYDALTVKDSNTIYLIYG